MNAWGQSENNDDDAVEAPAEAPAVEEQENVEAPAVEEAPAVVEPPVEDAPVVEETPDAPAAPAVEVTSAYQPPFATSHHARVAAAGQEAIAADMAATTE